jgi:hypothetical protein
MHHAASFLLQPTCELLIHISYRKLDLNHLLLRIPLVVVTTVSTERKARVARRLAAVALRRRIRRAN